MTDIVQFAVETARAAGAVLLEHYEGDFEVQTKSSVIDLVTEADKGAESAIIERIRATHPEHGILAEESGAVEQGQTCWVIDPLDGTTNFAHGFPHFCVSIALVQDKQPVVGVIHDPIRQETFWGERGQGAHVSSPRTSQRRLQVTGEDSLDTALLGTGFAYDRRTAQKSNVEEFLKVVRRVQGVRRAGSAALDLAYLAAGRFDGFWEFHLSPWDTAAGALLVEEAGGNLARLDGGPWTPWDDTVVAANPGLLPPLLELLVR